MTLSPPLFAESLSGQPCHHGPLVKADPGNPMWELSISYQRVGDIFMAQGNSRRSAESVSGRLRYHRSPSQGQP